MKRKRKVMVFVSFILSLLALISFMSLLRQTRADAIMEGVRRLRRHQCNMVPLSNKVTRMLTRNDESSERLFRNYMKDQGWEYICHYGRSGLYRKGSQEVLARKTPLARNYCIYEVLDENYFKYMRSEIREAA